ncbi:MAG: sigma-70 family RNA polymerase sigma factor [Chloroflexi bacterium]|nr:sigma-70 family RNA polymerase sigma factor [Chloroflexota bacterium]
MFAVLAPPAAPEATPVDQLALAYQAGQRQRLGELYHALEPLIANILRRVGAQRLPGALEAQDLAQQSWVILAELAQRWQPELGAFGAYVVSSLPWALERYIVKHSPARRAAHVQVISIESEEALRLMNERAGDDGRAWDDRLACQELLARLPLLERDVLTQHVVERRSFSILAPALGLHPSKAKRLFAVARATLQDKPPGVAASELGPELGALVRTLHQGAAADGLLPGRVWVCTHTGLSQAHYAQLVQCLVAAGAIRGRTARRPGWLVERDAEATLRRVKGEG